MQIITRPVKVVTEEREYFIADDGTEFGEWSDCYDYEKMSILNRMFSDHDIRVIRNNRIIPINSCKEFYQKYQEFDFCYFKTKESFDTFKCLIRYGERHSYRNVGDFRSIRNIDWDSSCAMIIYYDISDSMNGGSGTGDCWKEVESFDFLNLRKENIEQRIARRTKLCEIIGVNK